MVARRHFSLPGVPGGSKDAKLVVPFVDTFDGITSKFHAMFPRDDSGASIFTIEQIVLRLDIYMYS